MKSLVEEASSVIKAIEKAWNRAGCPQTFSVKIFETPETNFFGFTKKSAKVGVFFEEEVTPQQKRYTGQSRDQRSSQNNRQQPRGRTADPLYAREEKTDELVQVESRRTHHNGRQPQQGQRSQEQRPAESRQRESYGQRQEPAQQADHQDRQPNRERQQQRPNNRPSRPSFDRNDREQRDEQQPRQARIETATPFEEESRHEQRDYAPRQERSFEPRSHERANDERNFDHEEPRGEREGQRHEQEPRDRDRRSGGRNDRDRRNGSRGGDRNRGGRNNRPERTQRHEFDEQRPLFNEQHAPQETHHEAPQFTPEAMDTNASLIPQKKVLKVSGRRYTAPVKKTDEENN